MQAAFICAFLLFCALGLVTAGPGRMETSPLPVLARPRRVVVWTAWIGSLNLALNAGSLVCFLVVTPSVVAGLLFWLMPFSLVLAITDAVVYIRERRAVAGSSTPARRWAVALDLSLSILLLGLVALSIALFHGTQLGNLDPGGL